MVGGSSVNTLSRTTAILSVMAVFAGATRALARRPQSALRAARFVGQQAPGASARSATSLAARYVRIEASKIDTTETKAYPTPANGHSFRMNIFGLLFSDSEIMALQDCIWNGESFGCAAIVAAAAVAGAGAPWRAARARCGGLHPLWGSSYAAIVVYAAVVVLGRQSPRQLAAIALRDAQPTRLLAVVSKSFGLWINQVLEL